MHRSVVSRAAKSIRAAQLSNASWEHTLRRARDGDRRAQVDVGWELQACGDVAGALQWLRPPAERGDLGAMNLLGTLLVMRAPRGGADWLEAASEWLPRVIVATARDGAATAAAPTLEREYMHVKARERLGMVAFWRGDRAGARAHHRAALELCLRSPRLGRGAWPFLLPHDPPGLWEQLAREERLLATLAPLAEGEGARAAPPPPASRDELDARRAVDTLLERQPVARDGRERARRLAALAAYTRALRAVEAGRADDGDGVEFHLDLREAAYAAFAPSPPIAGAAPDRGAPEPAAYGVTYLHSWARVVASDACARALAASATAPRAPVRVLGAALGAAAVWSALLLGRDAAGVELLPPLVARARRLADGHARGGAGDVAFEAADATTADGGADGGAAMIWANDFAWPEPAQRALEREAARALRDDGCLVLYRAPHDAAAWRVVETVVAAVSWNPELKFHIARKNGGAEDRGR